MRNGEKQRDLQHVTLAIYDLSGRLVETLVDQLQEPGVYEIQWVWAEKRSGVYFYRLKIKELDGLYHYTTTEKMILLR